eukprot:3375346-Amphidinium_carterae.1
MAAPKTETLGTCGVPQADSPTTPTRSWANPPCSSHVGKQRNLFKYQSCRCVVYSPTIITVIIQKRPKL